VHSACGYAGMHTRVLSCSVEASRRARCCRAVADMTDAASPSLALQALGISGTLLAAGAFLMSITPGPDPRSLRQMPAGQRHWQQQQIQQMIKEAEERSSEENIEAAIVALGKFYKAV
jgi:hypothetical protein